MRRSRAAEGFFYTPFLFHTFASLFTSSSSYHIPYKHTNAPLSLRGSDTVIT